MKFAIEQCLKEKFRIGYAEFHNVCDGTVYRLDWTVWDWMNYGLAAFFIVVLIVVVSFMAWLFKHDIADIFRF